MLRKLSLLVVFALFVLAACAGETTSEPTASEPDPTVEVVEEAVEDEAMADDDAMSDDDEAMDDDESMADDDAMMDDDETMMDDDEAMADDDAMMDDDEAMADDDAMMDDDEAMADDDAMMDDETAALAIGFDGLEALGDDYVYEGWLIVDDAPLTTGRFTVADDGSLSVHEFEISAAHLEAATAFVLTIEPAVEDDPVPSDIHVVAGDFADGEADLTVAHPAALGNDFTDISGSYILAVPSAEEGTATYVNGIWFLDPAAGPAPSLDLPELPDGWVYEGWVANEDGAISTGRFTSVSGADSDGAGPAGGPNDAPAYPGQDFVDPTIDLTSGYAAVISIEPEPDNSPAPFAFKPLVDASIEDTGEAGIMQTLALNLDSLITGYAAFGDAAAMMMDDESMMDDEAMADDEAMMSDDESMMDDEAMMIELGEGEFALDISGLEDLGDDYVYEGWLIVNNAAVAAGRFSVNADGHLSEQVFSVDSADLAAATTYVLTIEPAVNDDPAPSAVHILGGDFDGDSTHLTIDHASALGTDFADAAGSTFFLAAPTGDDAPYQYGIWFAGLNLPELPAGWVYEGWVANADGAISTGIFRDGGAADSDAGGEAAGPNAAPDFPGQDFINPSIDLTDGYTAVISVEPDPDNSEAPFTLKPLVKMIEDAGAQVDQTLDYSSDSFPIGIVHR